MWYCKFDLIKTVICVLLNEKMQCFEQILNAFSITLLLTYDQIHNCN